MIRPLVLFPDPILRKQSAPVEKVTPEIRTLLDDMVETMYDAPGIGLAAPQVGVNLRVIVLDVAERDEENPEDAGTSRLYRLINPEIIEAKGEMESEEGCLSIPDLRESITRSAEIVVRAQDEEHNEVVIPATGLLAACLQHEIDHLDGVLFIDRLTRVKKALMKSKLQKLQRKQSKGRK